MQLQIATEKDHEYFKQWSQFLKIETLTCRPILNGMRVAEVLSPITYSFYMDEYDYPVGKITFFDFNSRNCSTEFGYTVNPQFHGKGIGTKLIEWAIKYQFQNTNLNKLYCQTAEFNKASIRILEKNGFHRDGILRQHHELDGKLYDDFIFSILREELS